MGYLSLSSSEFRSSFYQCEEDQPRLACRPMYNHRLDFQLDLDMSEYRPIGRPNQEIMLEGSIQRAVVESLQVVLPKDCQVDPFVHVHSTLRWSACYSISRDDDDAVDNITTHNHTFCGPARFALGEPDIPLDSVWLPPEKLFFSGLVFDSEELFTHELNEEIQRIPETLYRNLVEHQPDERLRDFPWLSTAYRMAEYLLTQNEREGKTLMHELQQSCKTVDAKSTLVCACDIWFNLVNHTLMQEVNYQLFMLQIVSRWPNFRLYYRIIPPNDQVAAEEGWILPWQLQCFAYYREPFRSLIWLLMRHGPKQTIKLTPPQNGAHQSICRWLLQCCGKLNERDGHDLFYGNTHFASQVQLTFYL